MKCASIRTVTTWLTWLHVLSVTCTAELFIDKSLKTKLKLYRVPTGHYHCALSCDQLMHSAHIGESCNPGMINPLVAVVTYLHTHTTGCIYTVAGSRVQPLSVHDRLLWHSTALKCKHTQNTQ